MADGAALQGLFLQDIRTLPVLEQLIEPLRGRHLLITGGTGFFGRWLLALIDELNQRGADITVTVISREPQRFIQANAQYRSLPWLEWVQSDIAAVWSLDGRPVDFIIHAAADTGATAHAKPLVLFDSIIGGCRRVLDYAALHGVQRVLLTGSGAQYGQLPDSGSVKEDFLGACASEQVSSVYGQAKRTQETLAAIYAQEHGLDVVLTRCFAFSGPGLPLDAHFAIGNFVRDALTRTHIEIHSSGEALRSYLHGADLAAWLLVLLLRGQPGRAYNVGSDEALSIADLAGRVIKRLAPEKTVRIMGEPDVHGRHVYVPDINRARELGLGIWTGLDDSIESMARYAIKSADPAIFRV